MARFSGISSSKGGADIPLLSAVRQAVGPQYTLLHDLVCSYDLREAIDGTTQVLKLAHFAELHGAKVELNGWGGNLGLLHAHLGCCLENTDYYEYFGRCQPGAERQRPGVEWGLTNALLVEDGHIAPPDGPGWGAEWDEDRFRSLGGA